MLPIFRSLLLTLSLVALAAGHSTADSPLTIIHSFDSAPDGAYPSAPLVQGADGSFYGTTSGGTSSNGSVFKIASDGTRTTLVAFDGLNNGANPNGLCLGTDGIYYGTTKNGGFFNMGTVFKMTPEGELTTLFSFSGPDGAWPVAGLTQGTDGNFYGSTYNGGYIDVRQQNLGTIFKITSTGDLTTLHVMGEYESDEEDEIILSGYNPSFPLLLARDGNFYGVASHGGDNSFGSLFRMTPAGEVRTMFSFGTIDMDLMSPSSAPVEGSDGFIYGAALLNVGMEGGGIYKMTPSGVTTVVHVFEALDWSTPTNSLPNGLVLGSDGNFYGTTQRVDYSSTGKGSVFKMDLDGNVTTLATFTGADGAKPTSSLVQGTDGNFYGTTFQGGTSNVGTVFKITPSGDLSSLSSFETLPVGALPKAPLLLARDGNFYGTTERGGSADAGTAFRISPTGDFTTLAAFDASTGAYPSAKLIQGADDNFYGTTSGGSEAFLKGSVFKMTADGSLSIMTTFSGAPETDMGAAPRLPVSHTSELVQGTDGNFYGANYPGGAGKDGRIFKVGPSFAFQSLATFDPTQTSIPYAGLTLGTDGKFYGANIKGWHDRLVHASKAGLVFSMTSGGSITNLLKPSPASTGSDPYAALLQGPNGNFYGTMATGGAKNAGTVFKVTPLGIPTTLFTFDGGVSGRNPRSGLILGQDGRFYGTTSGDPTQNDYGTIFSVSESGDLTTLYRFSGTDGSGPLGLVQHPNGTFYGVTSAGGPAGAGEIFVFDPYAIIYFPPISNQIATNKVRLAAKASTGVPVRFDVLSGPATVSSNLLSFTGTGLVTVQASEAVSPANTESAPPETRSFTVGAASQSIYFPLVPNQTFPGSSIQLKATASSKLPVTYSATGPATIANGLVQLTGAGTVKITASQAGNSVYGAASPTSITFSVAKGTQAITFPVIDSQFVGDVVMLGATASSGLPITYIVSGAATLSGKNLTLTGVGTVTVTATQPGDGSYSAATAVKLSFVVTKKTQSVTFPAVGGPFNTPLSLSASASSGLPVTYSVLSGPGTVSGNVLTFTGIGVVTVQATQPGNAIYNAAGIHIRITAGKAKQTIAFPIVPTQSVGSAPIKLTATSSAGLPLTFAVTGPGTLAGDVLTLTGAGTISVTASQAGNDLYNSASAKVTFMVKKASQTVTFPAVAARSYTSPPVGLTAFASSGLPITYSILSGPGRLEGNLLTLTGSGVATVQATQVGDANYAAAGCHIRITAR